MSRTDSTFIEKRVKQILSELLDIDLKEITNDAVLVDDLGMDSFTSIEIRFEIENNFGKQIPVSELTKIKSVGDIIKYITSHMSKKR